ncbi:hypothetical protein [Rhizobium laguerreae]|uniref:hypothetical protein n=1 Tax=Rhizobium laguerreae TaxID=1076926 RepID=UPI001FEEB4BE|nr:hypothetical protein [Rhizobium laguerreae]
MKLIGGCAAFFSPAACEVAAPIGMIKRRKTSNNLENRHFTKTETAKRTIKFASVVLSIRLAIGLTASKPDFAACCHPSYLCSLTAIGLKQRPSATAFTQFTCSSVKRCR